MPDSLWFKKSLSTALTYPRIYLAGIYLIWMLREDLTRRRLLKLSAWLLLFWVFDALVQAVVGYDLLGYAYPERLNGLFGPHDWKLGLTLAMLSPIVWAAPRPLSRRLGFHPVKLLAPLALVAVIAGVGAYQAYPKFAQRVASLSPRSISATKASTPPRPTACTCGITR